MVKRRMADPTTLNEFQAAVLEQDPRIMNKLATQAAIQRKANEMSARANLTTANVNLARLNMTLFDKFKPFILWGLALFFLIGPGLSAIMQIVVSLNLWWWIGFIILGIVFWRNK
jgi:hypothetical protein